MSGSTPRSAYHHLDSLTFGAVRRALVTLSGERRVVMDASDDVVFAIMEARRFGYAVAGLYAFQVYEWLLMLADEISLIHLAPWTCAKLGYLTCRYYPLFVWPAIVYTWLPDSSDEFCSRLVQPANALLIPLGFCPQGVMLMRAYAFTGRRKAILAALLPLYLALVLLNICTFGTHVILTRTPWGGTVCFPNDHLGRQSARMGALLGTAVLMDLASFGTIFIHAKRTQMLDSKLGKTFVRQSLCNSGHVLTINTLTAGLYFSFRGAHVHDSIGLAFGLVFTNVIACRMLLELRQRASPTNTELAGEHSLIVREGLRPRRTDPWTIEAPS